MYPTIGILKDDESSCTIGYRFFSPFVFLNFGFVCVCFFFLSEPDFPDLRLLSLCFYSFSSKFSAPDLFIWHDRSLLCFFSIYIASSFPFRFCINQKRTSCRVVELAKPSQLFAVIALQPFVQIEKTEFFQRLHICTNATKY